MAVGEAASLNGTEGEKSGRANAEEYHRDRLMTISEAPTDEPYDPHAHRDVEHPTTNGETLIHILKGSIGTGLLAMPDAFKNSGLIVGSIGICLIAFLCTYCLLMLIRCQYEICKKVRKPVISYSETMTYALRRGPKVVRFLLPLSRFLVDTFFILNQLGTCCIYIVFIVKTLEKVMGLRWIGFNMPLYTVFLLPFLIAIVLIRNLKHLAPFSQLANMSLFLAIGIILYFVFEQFPITSRNLIGNPINYALFFGTTLFAIEAPGVYLILENNMRTPKDFSGITGVFSLGIAFVSVVHMFMGVVGYVRYGDEIEGSITLNLPQDGVLPNLVNIIFAFNLYVTYALQFWVLMDVLWIYNLKNYFSESQNTSIVIEYVLRITCVVISCLIAIVIPYLNSFISLVGALCLSTLGITFPALIEICLFYPDKFGRMKYILLRDIVIVILGILAGALGTVLAARDIIKAMNAVAPMATANVISLHF